MKQSLASVLCASAVAGLLSMSPSAAEITIMSDGDDKDVRIILDRQSDDGVVTRESYRGHHFTIDEDNADGHIIRLRIENGNVVSTCFRDDEGEDEESNLVCSSDGTRVQSRHLATHDFTGLSETIRAELEAAMRNLDLEMAELDREMAALSHELSEVDWNEQHFHRLSVELADMADDIEETVMASLAESGIRIETDAEGNETVWIEGDDQDDPSMRVVEGADGSDLVFMYFDGFDQDYHYVIENDDQGDNSTTIHAFDVSTVEIVEADRRNGNIETETTSNGHPHLTVYTDDPDHVRVIELNRRRFDD